MKYYLVGGCVRDWLLGGAVLERDWVVVGGSPQQLISLGYRQVANHFPVFLHPDSGEEYALARKERGTGPGHQDFSFVFTPDISLEEDLIRRDFSINALALSEQILPASFSAQDHPDSDKMPLPASASEHIVDPWGGLRDLRAGVLRHLSSAFADDPLRVLRGLRFVAQLAPWRFSIAPATFLLMRELTTAGALKALPKERVWAEVAKVLSTPAPWLFFQQLAQLCPRLTKTSAIRFARSFQASLALAQTCAEQHGLGCQPNPAGRRRLWIWRKTPVACWVPPRPLPEWRGLPAHACPN